MAVDSNNSQALLSALRTELKALLQGGNAHASFEAAVEGLPVTLRGVVPEGLPYSAWQILEHLRIAQHDMLAYSQNSDGSYKERRWPEEYWPKEAEPANESDWDKAVAALKADRDAFAALLDKADGAGLVQPFAWDKGQNLLREVLQAADHNAYHVGELIVLRRVLGAWKK